MSAATTMLLINNARRHSSYGGGSYSKYELEGLSLSDIVSVRKQFGRCTCIINVDADTQFSESGVVSVEIPINRLVYDEEHDALAVKSDLSDIFDVTVVKNSEDVRKRATMDDIFESQIKAHGTQLKRDFNFSHFAKLNYKKVTEDYLSDKFDIVERILPRRRKESIREDIVGNIKQVEDKQLGE